MSPRAHGTGPLSFESQEDRASIINLEAYWGGSKDTLNLHPRGSEPEWVQSYYYAPEKLSHAPSRVRIKLNWSRMNSANASVTLLL